jgi:hypothetical protein
MINIIQVGLDPLDQSQIRSSARRMVITRDKQSPNRLVDIRIYQS